MVQAPLVGDLARRVGAAGVHIGEDDGGVAAARALLDHTEMTPEQIVRQSLTIAGELCIYTNLHHTIEVLE